MKHASAVQNSKDLFKHPDQTYAGTGRTQGACVNLRMKGIDHGSEQKPQNVKICFSP